MTKAAPELAEPACVRMDGPSDNKVGFRFASRCARRTAAYTVVILQEREECGTCLRSFEACRGWLAYTMCLYRDEQVECSREPRHA
jgi:hypothetical protein